ncbi:response regulator transcription factor [Nesterenkonia sp. CF4.4]|uniref:response regulator transcription factor n=1 Tax=Nesterenkonia sp. CF4.4 TaxID=3373079 RepID=UPI003EE7809B
MAHRILLVEDDDGIALPLTRALTREGYSVQREAAGEPAVLRLRQEAVDLIILDLGLPDIDGLDVCRRVRENGFAGAVLILTARGAEIDRVVGLDVGADDYMAKPFGLAELLARVRALLRRGQPCGAAPADSNPSGAQSSSAAAPVPDLGPAEPGPAPREDSWVSVDTNARQAFVGGVELPLTAKEFDVLALVDAERGAVVTREDLMDQVWDVNWFGSTKTLDVTMGRLRHKLEAARCSSQIVTVRGVGFRLEDLIRSA